MFGFHLKRRQRRRFRHFFEFFSRSREPRPGLCSHCWHVPNQRTKSKKEGGEGADLAAVVGGHRQALQPPGARAGDAGLESAIARIETSLKMNQKRLERILICLADETGAAEAGRNSGRASDGIAGGGEGMCRISHRRCNRFFNTQGMRFSSAEPPVVAGRCAADGGAQFVDVPGTAPRCFA